MGKLHENTVFIRCMGQKHAPLACTTDGCSACGGRWGSSRAAGRGGGPLCKRRDGGRQEGQGGVWHRQPAAGQAAERRWQGPRPCTAQEARAQAGGGAPHRITCMQACALADVVSCCMRMTMHARAGEEGGRVQVQGLHGESALAPGLGNRAMRSARQGCRRGVRPSQCRTISACQHQRQARPKIALQ